MPALIDSAPDCVTSAPGAVKGDADDFVLQHAYESCAGFMTFGPGSTYGDEGEKAATMYYLITALGAVVLVAALVAWVLVEHRTLVGHVVRLRERDGGAKA
jgi:hypothetical protein